MALNGDPKRREKGSGPPPVTTTSLAGRERLGVGVKMYCVEGMCAWQGRAGPEVPSRMHSQLRKQSKEMGDCAFRGDGRPLAVVFSTSFHSL